ncbi:MalY/PatB family protein [Paenibacillus periandrae]|uniref:MalY/PatB family protein n=1 Tax=Paenibacillus periandrae TaxID=1761741 RepID=UPI001F09D1D3|nr:MalY/PatB family protein [Paenibacillus periandrae]
MEDLPSKHNFEEVIKRRGTDAKKHNVYPEDIIPMGIAETDFKCPQPIIDAMVNRAEHGIYGYPLNSTSFNQAVIKWQGERFEWEIEEEWVEFAPAIVTALVTAIQAFTHPGDKVVIQTPVYHPFHSIVTNNGRIKAVNQLILKDGKYLIDFEDLEYRLKDPRTKLMLLCNPHNPVGRVYTREELLKIGELCLKHNVIVASDEIHSDLVYSGHKHIPFPTLSEELQQISLVFINPSKTFNLAGLRTAAVITPNRFLRETYRERVLSNRVDGRTVFGTLPFEIAYNECGYYADQIVEYLEQNVNYLLKYFEEKIPAIKVIQPEATYLIWLDCRDLRMTQEALNRFMLEQAKLGLNDGILFGEEGRGFMRMNIGCRRAVLEDALQRIENAVNELS